MSGKDSKGGKPNHTTYRLYQEVRCFGNQTLRAAVARNLGLLSALPDNQTYLTKDTRLSKMLVAESENMQTLLAHVLRHGDTSKTYVVRKYIDGDLRWRRLGSSDRSGRWNHGDLTTTWVRWSYHPGQRRWKASNFRYPDEVVA